MKSTLQVPFFVLFLSLLVGGPAAGETPEEFAELFESQMRGLTVEPGPAGDGRDVRYILVTGIGGEYDPFYFRDVRKELVRLSNRDSESREKRVFVLRPPTSRNPSENISWVNRRFLVLSDANPNARFVIVAHSKGALEVMGALAANPMFAATKVKATVFVQGPFKGTPLAQLFKDNVPAHRLPFLKRMGERVSAWGIQKVFTMARVPPEQLTPTGAQGFTESVLSEHGDSFEQLVLPQSYFLASDWPGLRRFSWSLSQTSLSLCGRALQYLSPGPSDGLIKTESHILPGAEHRGVQIPNLPHSSMANLRPFSDAFARTVYQVGQNGR